LELSITKITAIMKKNNTQYYIIVIGGLLIPSLEKLMSVKS